MRYLEGEAYLYNGIVHLVKGFQHPPGFLIAYPRYSIIRKTKLQNHEKEIATSRIYWDCLKTTIPVIPTTSPYYTGDFIESKIPLYLKTLLEELLETPLYLTGSALITSEYNDLDFIVYGATEDTVYKLAKLFNNGVIKKSEYILVKEYIEKHSHYTSLFNYLYYKKNTLLHGVLEGVHVNFKLLSYERGFNTCIDPVEDYTYYSGPVKIARAENLHILPGRYTAVLNNGVEVVLETLREVYAELEPGEYYVFNARIEHRGSGVYLVPDHGVLTPRIP